MAWTDEMVDELTKMWGKGLTTNEIAKALGVSKNSVVGKVHRLNLDARPSPIKKKEEEKPNKAKNSPLKEKISSKAPVQSEPSKEVKKSHASPKKEEEKPATEESVQIESKLSPNPTFHKNTCIKLADLDSHTCRWPIGDPRDDNFCFCGRHVKSGQTYCEEHAAIAYVKPMKKEK